MRHLLIILSLLPLMAAPARATLLDDFQQLWSSRAAGFIQDRADRDASVKVLDAKIAAFATMPSPTATTDKTAYLLARHEAAAVTARAALLDELRTFMKKKPSAAVATAWLQGKIDRLRALQEQVNLETAPLAGDAAKTMPEKDYFRAAEQVAMKRGTLEAQTAELILINDNLAVLYAAKTEADERGREAFAAFGRALAQSSQQPIVQSQPLLSLPPPSASPPQRNSTATCNIFGKSSCGGN
jgi:hypothetical protein